jgi:hypothetical protein
MDVTASLSELLRDQNLARSAIYSAVFPLGYQDAAAYLLDTLGGDPSVVFAKQQARDRGKFHLLDDTDRIPARASLRFSSCCKLDEQS